MSKKNINVSLNEIMVYSLRIIKNILKYHKNFKNLESLLEYIAQENDIDLSLIRKDQPLYSELYNQCKQYCETRCEYMPYERSYWYDILLTMIKTEKLAKSSKKILKN